MQQIFEITQASGNILSQILENNSLEKLNMIPDGFKNNLIWNIAHVVVVQQILVYNFSGLPMMVSDEMVEKYKKGTQPEHDATQAEVDEIKSLLNKTIAQTKEDFDNGVFKNYIEYPTSTGFVIKTAVDAIAFNNFHEGLHIGIIMGLRKFI